MTNHVINYAHRGASAYAAQNTLSAFYLGLACGADGIETDIRRTADGVLVLFHDKTLDATTDGTGTVSEHTFKELRELTVFGQLVNDKILSFEEFLDKFAYRDLSFAIELKQKGTEEEVSDLIFRYGIADRTIITSFGVERIAAMRKHSPSLKTGLLVKELDEETVKTVQSLGCYQICPPAPLLTAENVASLKAIGFSVRAWGVSDEELMKKCVDIGVDGMTVNFPDLLTRYLQSKPEN